LLRFGSGAFRRRPLVSSPAALERLFIASLVGSGAIVAGRRLTPEVAYSRWSNKLL
jgi:hypothetical protein